MVSYYPPMPYSQKHSNNLAYPGQQWNWTPNYHPPANQFFNDVDSPHPHHQMYYSHMFHPQAPGTPGDWHSPTSSAENFSQNSTSAHQMLQQHHVNNLVGVNNQSNNHNVIGSNSSASSGSSTTSSGPNSGNTQLNETNSSISEQHIAEGLPSPPITVSGSEISSPGAPNSSSSPHHVPHHLNNNINNNSPSTNNNNSTSAHNNNRTSPVKTQLYDWMKKPSYPAQPAPGPQAENPSAVPLLESDFTELLDSGKTRTKDKYRVVYTDYQRLELEKEYCTSRYITIRRKTELAQSLQLSERQVKIWFQNRRAKERKQSKKVSDPTMMSSVPHNDYLMDTKQKLDSGLLQHPLHLNPVPLGMPAMRLHHHLHSHGMMSTAQLQQLHNPSHAQMSAAAAAAASVGAVPM